MKRLLTIILFFITIGIYAQDTQVSVFNYDGLNGNPGSTACNTENANLIGIINALPGYTVDGTIDSFANSVTLASQLDASTFFFMTDMENKNPTDTDFFPVASRGVIENWVNSGGVMVMTGTSGTRDVDFLNLIFSWDLENIFSTSWTKNTTNTAGTPFDTVSATTLTNLSATQSISKGTVANFTAMWGIDSDAVVAVIKYGAGYVIYMGYDFYNTGPGCPQYSSAWVQEVIPAALDYASALSSSTVKNITEDSGDFEYEFSETGTTSYILVPGGSTAPTATQIAAGVTYAGVTILDNGAAATTANVTHTFNLTGLSPNTNYDIYAVTYYNDSVSNVYSDVEHANFSTLPNEVPVGSAIANQSECINGAVSGLSFNITDSYPGDNTFIVTATSSNTSVVANGDITITGTGNTRSIAINSMPDASGTSTITVSMEDSLGAIGTLTFDMTFNDTILPTLTAVANQNENVDTSCNFTLPDYTGLTTAADNCGTATVTQSPSIGTVISGHGTVQTITLTADDGNGNTNTTTFDVTLADAILPTLTAVADQNENVDTTCNFTLPDYTGLTTAADNCGTTTVTQSPSIGTVISGHGTVQNITLTADDGNGNTNTTTFDVTLADAILPTLTAVADQNENVDTACNFTLPDYTGLTTAADNCGTTTVTQSPSIGTVISGHGTVQTITLTADDGNGNTNTTTFDVTLADAVLPTLTAVANQNENVDTACNFTLPDYTGLTTAADNCGTATVTQSPSIGTVISGHGTVQTITLTADDGNGNTNTTTFDVTLADAILPTLTAVADQNENVDAACNFTLPDYTGLTTAADNCGTTTVTQSPSIGTVISGHGTVQTITLTADDGNGNTNTTTFDVTLADAILPTLTAVADQNENVDTACNFTLPDYTGLTTAADNCGTATVTQSPSIGTVISGHGTVQTITLTADDGNGNTNTTTFDVILVDAILPTLTAVADQNENVDTTCNFTLPDYTGLTTAADNCGTATVTQSPSIGTVISGHGTVQTITLTADDGNGNTNTTTFDVTLADAILPTLTAVADQNENVDTTCNFTLPDYTGLTTAADNCGTATVTQSPSIGTVISGHGTVQTITLTADDGNGNTNTTTFDVTLIDLIAPTVITQNITVQLDATGTASITTAQIDNGSTDTCGIENMSLDITDFDCSNLGTNTVTLTVTDINGNSDSATAIVTIEDTIAPTVLTKGITLQLEAGKATNITAAQIDNLSYDNCGIASYEIDKTSFDCSNLGPNTVTLTVTDKSGNSNTGTTVIMVKDNTSPILLTKDITATIDDTGSASVIAEDFIEESSDNCSISTISIDRTNFDCEKLGDYTVTLTLTDSSGNAVTKTAKLTLTGEDTDGDLIADSCDDDDDNDGIPDIDDDFPKNSNPLLVPAEAFTPNGDGINDYWIIPGINNYANSVVNVYNRSGYEVFTTKGYQNDWNGHFKSNSEKLPSGSYLYVIDLGNGSPLLKGWVFINY